MKGAQYRDRGCELICSGTVCFNVSLHIPMQSDFYLNCATLIREIRFKPNYTKKYVKSFSTNEEIK